MADIDDFEKIGGKTLALHGPLLTDTELRDRLERQIKILEDYFGLRADISRDDWINFYLDNKMVSGVDIVHSRNIPSN